MRDPAFAMFMQFMGPYMRTNPNRPVKGWKAKKTTPSTAARTTTTGRSRLMPSSTRRRSACSSRSSASRTTPSSSANCTSTVSLTGEQRPGRCAVSRECATTSRRRGSSGTLSGPATGRMRMSQTTVTTGSSRRCATRCPSCVSSPCAAPTSATMETSSRVCRTSRNSRTSASRSRAPTPARLGQVEHGDARVLCKARAAHGDV